jgi:hypothetical protein
MMRLSSLQNERMRGVLAGMKSIYDSSRREAKAVKRSKEKQDKEDEREATALVPLLSASEETELVDLLELLLLLEEEGAFEAVTGVAAVQPAGLHPVGIFPVEKSAARPSSLLKTRPASWSAFSTTMSWS